ncbi:MAG: hypothetical protein ACOC2E_05450 [Bacteroidota bacterium]
MQVSLDIDIDQLLLFIKNLPEDQLLKIRNELNITIEKKTKEKKKDFLELISNAPTMSDQQYKTFQENRKTFNQWRNS